MFKFKDTGFGKIVYSDKIPELTHFFTTRSTDVDNNKKNILKYLKVDEENLISPKQTHSTNIRFADAEIRDYPDTDGLILNNYTQTVFLRFADCTPIILYDKKADIGAVVHAGWRGTVGQIAVAAVNKIVSSTSSELSDIYAVIGPAIGMCCYNVGEDVEIGIKNSVQYSDKLIKSVDNKTFVDLKQTNFQQLIESGIPEANIDVCPYCTSCNNDLFYSYRKENGTLNRHNAVIKLNSK